MNQYQSLLLERGEDGILIIQINRPDKLNALNSTVISEIGLVFENEATDEETKGIILTGVGEKAFVAGADIAEFANHGSMEAKVMSRKGHKIFNAIEAFPKPVIAAINGFSLGGGNELAMACHLRIAAPHARFGQPEVKLGLLPGYGATQRLVHLIGKGRALYYLMTADMFKADAALQMGFVNQIAEEGQLIETCKTVLNKIIPLAPKAVAFCIECANAAWNEEEDGFEKEIHAFGEAFDTEDFKEGSQAFLEKRKPIFKGK